MCKRSARTDTTETNSHYQRLLIQQLIHLRTDRTRILDAPLPEPVLNSDAGSRTQQLPYLRNSDRVSNCSLRSTCFIEAFLISEPILFFRCPHVVLLRNTVTMPPTT